MAYLPIEEYGIIGDLHTVALVGSNGSIDWFCYPRFDSPSIFGAILDDEKGGRFQITPIRGGVTYKQLYIPDTNVLMTRFLTADGVSEVIDFMPIHRDGKPYKGRLIRRVKMVRGTMPLRLECHPAFDYGRVAHKVELCKEGAIFWNPHLNCALLTRIPLQTDGSCVFTTFTLREEETTTFVFQEIDPEEGCGAALSEAESDRLLEETEDYWQRWLSHSRYRGRWREMVNRSALVLKLLTYAPTGAIVAAPTCSLPEAVGGKRNWDYRYTWIRDASFTLYGLMRLGFTEEAEKFMGWIKKICEDLSPDGALQVMYGIDGRKDLTEEELSHWKGYRGSTPVRIGNAAAQQLQLDIYGELMDSVYLFNKYGTPIDYDLWVNLYRLLDWVCDHWHLEDEGIWEVRGGRRHFVYSKLMCWVALDRGLRLADKRSFPANRDRWLKTRDLIYQEIMTKGFNRKRNAFVQSYGSDTLDASCLIMPLVFFVSPTDPKMIGTLQAINQPPSRGGLVSDSLVYRYNVNEAPDGVGEGEGTFSMCTFWLVEALTRAGDLRTARFIFEKMLTYANHLGLYAEEIGPSGEALGNFPQAFTHLGLISAAYNLDRKLGARQNRSG
ncbi:MAG: glycoside hydrolase family 15 protein [Nitrospinota bacterium]|nr:MAG: glycoside hydrolase family 15 protein [Nitrospinota bacterium]